ncbi:aminotransferase class V-fold PLP-dependent enzyme [Dokdonella soli]|uniref:Aminotransferase class V-fold PLP-dependent enzyme n=1 Tax=Dokdonella soli TaxID=529810 RepID=A0ABN1IDI5_9GAMM
MPLSRRSFLAMQGGALGAALLPSGLLAAVQAKTPPLPPLDDWDKVRAQFRLSPDYLHFAGFYLASHPESVRAAVDGFRRALDENPFLIVEHGMFESDAENLQRKVREDIAAYLGGHQDEIALTPNTTTGLALVYHGLPLKAGDEVLVTTHDHVVHHESIRLSTERNGASVRKITLFDEASTASIDGIVARVHAAIRPQTRVLGITWVHSSTGMRLPVRQIAAVLKDVNRDRDEATRVLLVVDGVHGIGAVDETIADLGCDFFCAGTHKWIFAPRGTGLVWARADNWARLRPLIPSFSDAELYEAWKQNRAPRGPNVANRITPGGFQAYEHQWAMGAAFRMHRQIGRTRIAERIRDLNDQCKRGLAAIPKVKLHTPRDAGLSAGICCFEVEGSKPNEIVGRLLARKVIASSSPYAISYARLSAGLMNTPEQVDQALAAVREATKAAG